MEEPGSVEGEGEEEGDAMEDGVAGADWSDPRSPYEILNGL